MIRVEQGAWDAAVQMLAGILFLTPLKSMFKRVLTNMKHEDGEEGFWEYHFPHIVKWMNRNK